ncbi:arsenosugar biosynthesis radical SAM (seleno)protein ArsS [Methylophaga sp. OBS4]|uniref:arsenosugar biosynthesis radical SAM (seleno)protein ArsS n=1 Tax=Methylophaga sp. OBS4 TaxID=2991935 RepID=UPI002251EC71|nr:arsenosugar biosynthesis radical SAM (seleno)protein ArsS [Methylophaga sp. OBS4]MCX4186519.1 arsenosugar biosynthesis radical SAM protein ArsS [Methylophaga sp. OBS4]
MHETLAYLKPGDFPVIHRQALHTLQVNLGYLCNQSCVHCHVNAGPNRTEMMDEDNLQLLVELLDSGRIKNLDLTGGAPEMHAFFRYLVMHARHAGVHVIDRCNLTILSEPGYEDMAQFLADHQVEVVASLPCYSPENVDGQRGKGVFGRSIQALQSLNALGYGKQDKGLILNLVYNPQGPSLPPGQQQLEQDYKRELQSHFGITFNRLFTMTNMPIKRFGSMLISKGQFDDYLNLLRNNYQADNLKHVMCRNVISVDWQGYLYDCDFNQQLGLPLGEQQKPHLRDLLAGSFEMEKINTANHCYGCTAGQGSSCGGAL